MTQKKNIKLKHLKNDENLRKMRRIIFWHFFSLSSSSYFLIFIYLFFYFVCLFFFLMEKGQIVSGKSFVYLNKIILTGFKQ
jgi:hypothetical protein